MTGIQFPISENLDWLLEPNNKHMQDIINSRCGWAGTDPLYTKYHDEEWGRPVTDDKTLFEFKQDSPGLPSSANAKDTAKPSTTSTWKK